VLVGKYDCDIRRGLHTTVMLAAVKLWDGVMWVPTEYEAVLMYAQFLKARHGTAASKLARNTAKTLQDEGDLEGHKIWDAVADAIEQTSRLASAVVAW